MDSFEAPVIGRARMIDLKCDQGLQLRARIVIANKPHHFHYVPQSDAFKSLHVHTYVWFGLPSHVQRQCAFIDIVMSAFLDRPHTNNTCITSDSQLIFYWFTFPLPPGTHFQVLKPIVGLDPTHSWAASSPLKFAKSVLG